jgi:hypothetical protein
MNIEPVSALRVARCASGQWEVLEDGRQDAIARFTAPQSALSYACELAEGRQASLVVVFDQPSALTRRRPVPAAHTAFVPAGSH